MRKNKLGDISAKPRDPEFGVKIGFDRFKPAIINISSSNNKNTLFVNNMLFYINDIVQQPQPYFNKKNKSYIKNNIIHKKKDKKNKYIEFFTLHHSF